jgi:hypothetical protein
MAVKRLLTRVLTHALICVLNAVAAVVVLTFILVVVILSHVLRYPAACVARHVSLCRIRRLRVGDTFHRRFSEHLTKTTVVVSADAERILLLDKYECSRLLPVTRILVGDDYMLHWFGRGDADMVWQWRCLGQMYGISGLCILLTPHPTRRMGHVELASLIADARVVTLASYCWGGQHVVSRATTCRVMDRALWELERPVRRIQRAWRAWRAQQVQRRKRAVAVIEDALLEALYRPGSGWHYLAAQRLRWGGK